MSNLNHQVLRTAEFWGADPATFEIIETHLSWVFLVNDLAYKLKKPVSLYFVDTTSLENRKHFCQEEIRLNSRWAQPYYLGVETINGEADEPVLNGDGEVLDYLVKMSRWSPEQQLDHQTLETIKRHNWRCAYRSCKAGRHCRCRSALRQSHRTFDPCSALPTGSTSPDRTARLRTA